ncbi:MAG: DUF5411 family protein [bacterium]
MKSAYWGYWLVLLGIFVMVIMMLIQNVTTANTQSYSLLQELAEAAMIDAIDYGYYRQYGEIKMNKEKFMEVFVSRMSETFSGATTYTIEFYEIYEAPPKVSVKVSSSSETFNLASDSTTFDLVDTIDGILEGGYKEGIAVTP